MKTPFGWPANFRLFSTPMDDKQAADYTASSPWMQKPTDGYIGGSLDETFYGTYDWLTWTPIETESQTSILTHGTTDTSMRSANGIEICEGKDSMPGNESDNSIEVCEGADRMPTNNSDATMETCEGKDSNIAHGVRSDVKTGGMDPMPNSSDKKSMEICVGNDANGVTGTEGKAGEERAEGIGVATWLDPAFVAEFGITGWMVSSAMLGFQLQSSDAAEMGSELALQIGKNVADLELATSSEQGTKARGWFDEGMQAGFGF